jgi:hypothetical protein
MNNHFGQMRLGAFDVLLIGQWVALSVLSKPMALI